jgi:hypothetical protein
VTAGLKWTGAKLNGLPLFTKKLWQLRPGNHQPLLPSIRARLLASPEIPATSREVRFSKKVIARVFTAAGVRVVDFRGKSLEARRFAPVGSAVIGLASGSMI